jgi:hypothetical protein
MRTYTRTHIHTLCHTHTHTHTHKCIPEFAPVRGPVCERVFPHRERSDPAGRACAAVGAAWRVLYPARSAPATVVVALRYLVPPEGQQHGYMCMGVREWVSE